MACGARTGYERVFVALPAGPDRAIAIYDAFGSVIDATASRQVAPRSGSLPLVTDVIQRNAPARKFLHRGGPGGRWCASARCSRVTGDRRRRRALDAQFLELSEWDQWRRTAVRARRADALADRHHLAGRALVGHAPDGADRRVDAGISSPASRWPTAGGRRRCSSARWPPRSPARPARCPGAGVGRRGGAAATDRREPVDGGAAQAVRRDPVRRAADLRRLEPRAGQPRAARAGAIGSSMPASGLVTALEPVMRACGGCVGGARQRQRRPRGGRARSGVPTRRSRLHASPRVAHRASRRRATTTASPTRACGRSATSCTRGRCSAPTTGSSTARSTRSSPTPSLEEMARPSGPSSSVQDYHFALLPQLIKAAQAGRARRHLLAHPVAELRGLRHLPLADGDPAGPARAPISSASTPSSTATTSWRRSERAIEARDRVGALHGRTRRSTRRAVQPFPISVAAGRSCDDPPTIIDRWRPCEPSWASPSEWLGHRRRAGRLHQGAPRAHAGDPALLRAVSGVPPAHGLRADRRRRAAPGSRATRPSSRRSGGRCRTHQRGAGRAGLAPIVYLERHHDHARDPAATTGRADFCMVTSLHDGMNLVAKEYVVRA